MGNLSFQNFLQEHIVGNLTEIPTCDKQKNRENTRQRKTVTCTRQYLRDSAICLRPRSYRDFTIIREKEIQDVVSIFSLTQKHVNNLIKTLITKVGSTMG